MENSVDINDLQWLCWPHVAIYPGYGPVFHILSRKHFCMSRFLNIVFNNAFDKSGITNLHITVHHHQHHHHHRRRRQSSAQGQVFHCKLKHQGCSYSQRSSTSNVGTKVAVLLGINRCGSFPLLSPPHSPFSIWTDLKRSVKRSQGHHRGGEESGVANWALRLHRNSPQGLNISSIRVFDQIRDPEIPKTICPHSCIN